MFDDKDAVSRPSIVKVKELIEAKLRILALFLHTPEIKDLAKELSSSEKRVRYGFSENQEVFDEALKWFVKVVDVSADGAYFYGDNENFHYRNTEFNARVLMVALTKVFALGFEMNECPSLNCFKAFEGKRDSKLVLNDVEGGFSSKGYPTIITRHILDGRYGPSVTYRALVPFQFFWGGVDFSLTLSKPDNDEEFPSYCLTYLKSVKATMKVLGSNVFGGSPNEAKLVEGIAYPKVRPSDLTLDVVWPIITTDLFNSIC